MKNEPEIKEFSFEDGVIELLKQMTNQLNETNRLLLKLDHSIDRLPNYLR
jgi:hypothetical protein